jgi:hypothetical protein
VTLSTPRTFVSIMRSQSSGSASWIGASPAASPAEFTSTSTSRHVSGSAPSAARTASRSRTSSVIASVPMPCSCSSSSASASSRSPRRATSTSRSPAAANERAHASPMPLDAPVTTTVRFAIRTRRSSRRAGRTRSSQCQATARDSTMRSMSAPEAPERGHVLAVRDADDVLLDDRAGVEVLGDVVGGRADQLHAALTCLPVRVRTDEGRAAGSGAR